MAEKRRGLGRGISALIPQSSGTEQRNGSESRPVDVFFPDQNGAGRSAGRDGSDAAAREAAPTAGAGRRGRVSVPPVTVGRSGTELSTAQGEGTTTPDEETAAAPAPAAEPSAKTRGSGKPATSKKSAPSRKSAASKKQASTTTPAPADTGTGAGASVETDETVETVAGTPSPAPSDDGLLPVPGASFAELPVEEITPNARQPRQVFDEDDLDELTASITEVGLLQPIVVRPRAQADVDAGESPYELVMGERRWRATQRAGLTTIPAIIRTTTDDDLLRDALLENLHRAQLNPLEEASAYQQLLEDFSCTHEELARRIARSRPQISNTLRLLKLPPLVQRRVASGVLSAGHARALLGLPDAAAMERLAQRIVAEGLSVRSTEEIVALGDEPAEPELRRRKRESPHSETLSRLSYRLADRFDTRVKVTMGQRKGKITIEFAGAEDLERILDTLAPGDRGLTEPGLGDDAGA